MNQPSKSVLLMLLCLAAAFPLIARADTDKSVTAAQVNGTWKTKSGEFKIWALGKQRLQVEFSGVYEYKTPQGRMANESEGSGIASIEGDTAIQTRRRRSGMPDHAQIHRRQISCHPNGICGFGHNMSTEGTYRKVSSKKPKFESD
ncbi:MAG TPA: hypothetical protein VKD89_10290 [Candidatus Udaeobacter sp.]|nr:hypothetical protein [Candidatus Udaeobacter sp.]